MLDARARLGSDISVQGNVDPIKLFSTQEGIAEAIQDCVQKAGKQVSSINFSVAYHCSPYFAA